MSDIQNLINRCKNGDRDSFNELVIMYQSKVINIAYGILCDSEDAADAAQEVFIKVYRSIGNFKEQSSLSTWIYRITVNVCTDILRKNGKHSKVLSINSAYSEEGQDFDIKDESQTPEEATETKETQLEVRRAISTLKDEYRAVLTLYDIEGLSYDRISAVLQIPVGTVKSRLNRARFALKKELVKKRNFFKY